MDLKSVFKSHADTPPSCFFQNKNNLLLNIPSLFLIFWLFINQDNTFIIKIHNSRKSTASKVCSLSAQTSWEGSDQTIWGREGDFGDVKHEILIKFCFVFFGTWTSVCIHPTALWTPQPILLPHYSSAKPPQAAWSSHDPLTLQKCFFAFVHFAFQSWDFRKTSPSCGPPVSWTGYNLTWRGHQEMVPVN